MYVFRIIIIVSLLLAAAVPAAAQQKEDSVVTAQPDTPRANTPPEPFDVKGTKIADSTIAFGSDTILPADTTKVKKHSAWKAVWLSALVPGLGQAYNKKYWKMPIIYAGFGGLGYALYYTSSNFNEARAAYRIVVRGGAASYLGYTDADDIKYFRDTYKNFLNISALVTVVWYGLQLIDAAVDGHLYSYNMDNNLSINFDPSFLLQNNLGMNQTCLGLTFTIVPLAKNHGKQLEKTLRYF
jgi:hypothetical protein